MTPKALAALHARAYQHGRPWSAQDFDTLLKSNGAFLVANKTGFALGRTVADEAELLMLAVDPNQQGRGHGRTFLAGFEYTAAQGGAQSAFLEVAEDNAAATGLYTSAGYQEVGRRANYYRRDSGHADALVLKKRLKSA